MKSNFLLFVVIMLVVTACKKETVNLPGKATETVNPPETTVNSFSSCSGNNWELGDLYYGDLSNHGYLGGMAPWVYNNKIYVPDYDDQVVRIYDGVNWQTLASNIPFETLPFTVSFTIGNKGYLLSTTTGILWLYNIPTNTWTQRASSPAGRRYSPATFTIGSKGYVAGGGKEEGTLKDVWEYYPATNAWTRKADLPDALAVATGFSIDDKGYIVAGNSTMGNYRRLYQYDPASNEWSRKALFPGEARWRPIAFVIAGKAYVGGGYTAPGGVMFNDYYRYNPVTNAWNAVADMPVPDSRSEHGFTLNSKGYGVFSIGGGYGMLEYTPLYCTPVYSTDSN